MVPKTMSKTITYTSRMIMFDIFENIKQMKILFHECVNRHGVTKMKIMVTHQLKEWGGWDPIHKTQKNTKKPIKLQKKTKKNDKKQKNIKLKKNKI